MTSQPLEADERKNLGLFTLWQAGIHWVSARCAGILAVTPEC